MKSILLTIFKGRVISPYWILLIDLGLVTNSFFIAFTLRLNMSLVNYSFMEFLIGASWVLLIYLISFLIFGSYRGVIRHTNYSELKLLTSAYISAFLTLLIAQFVTDYFNVNWIFIPKLALVFHFMLALFLAISFRMLVKETYSYLTKKKDLENAFIYGAGEMGLIAYDAINNDKNSKYEIVGFIDDDPSKWNMILNSKPVYNWKKALEVRQSKQATTIILAISNISSEQKHQISDECLNRGWKLKVMPTVGNWINGISNPNQIRDIRIEDLLGRDEIKLNQKRIAEGLSNKSILVSGAAGSIGSEIVRQLLRFPIKNIIMVDQSESALYDLQQELLLSYSDSPFTIIVADITNKTRLERIFNQYKPNLVFHAAAYKHVPLMENYPFEAIRVNVGGTKLLADLSVSSGVEKFIMISTDKAVNPTNVMGASKRICEIYIQSLSQRKDIQTSFITTRFGNVLGSNGSVVPLFKKQIERGGPVTVTHPDITRFFMTIPEACQLVLEAGFMGSGGEIFVFDMGEAVKIDDLAKEMIRLAGLQIGEDIEIKYTGLREGEKLYEELLAAKENTLPTHHEKIMIGKVRPQNFEVVNAEVSELINSINYENEELSVKRMKKIVPEFISMNSIYNALDAHVLEGQESALV